MNWWIGELENSFFDVTNRLFKFFKSHHQKNLPNIWCYSKQFQTQGSFFHILDYSQDVVFHYTISNPDWILVFQVVTGYVIKNVFIMMQRCRWVFKPGWASSNVVGIICPLVVIGLTELPNSGWACRLKPTLPITVMSRSQLTVGPFMVSKIQQTNFETTDLWFFIVKLNMYYCVKFGYSEKATKFEKKSSTYNFTLLSSGRVKFKWIFFTNFVAFSEYPNFTMNVNNKIQIRRFIVS